jgi:hypothetical protein
MPSLHPFGLNGVLHHRFLVSAQGTRGTNLGAGDLRLFDFHFFTEGADNLLKEDTVVEHLRKVQESPRPASAPCIILLAISIIMESSAIPPPHESPR